MVRILGVEVKPNNDRVFVRCALIEGTYQSYSFIEDYELKSSLDDLPERAFEVASSLRSLLQGLKVQTVAIRRAETLRASNQEGPRARLVVEGALIAFARLAVQDTRFERASEFAHGQGLSKDQLDALGDAVAPANFRAAAAAAIAALP